MALLEQDLRCVRRWLTVAFVSLLLAGVLSLLVVVARVPPFDRLVGDPLFFKRCLVAHVDLALVVWFYAFLAALFYLVPGRRPSNTLSRESARLGGVGVALLVAGAAVPQARPLLANYVPLIDSPLFITGLAAIGAALTFAFLDGRLLPRNEGAAGVLDIPPAARVVTDLGRAGELKLSGTIVLRLETPAEKPPPLLREASYRIFRRRSWLAETTTNDWREISSTEPNGTTYVLFPGKTNLASLNIGCYLEGGNDLLPLPSGTARLENLMAIELQRNPLGAVLDKGPGLVVFDALYGPGQTIDDPANTNLDQTVTNLDETVANLEETITNRAVTNLDLVVPRRERPALDLVIAQLHLQGQSRKQVLRTLSAFFTDQFTYSTRPNPLLPLSTNETALSRFLLEERRGHCEYFATAGVLLLRRLGIPARYAVGYAVHEGSGRKFVVRQRDAHAWCLVWNESANIWQDFDPTPPSWIQAEAKPLSAWQALSDFWSRLRFEVSKIWWGQTHLRQYLLAIVVPILLLLFYQIVFRRRRRRQEGKAAAAAVIAWPGLDSEFYQLELKLAGLGLARQPSEPLSEWLQRAVEAPALASFREPLKALLRLHYRYRFDPLGLGREEREELRREAKACLEKVGDSRVMRDA